VHLLADRFYNGRFRTFWNACGAASDETLRKDKQSDFDLFGRSLPITRRIDVTPGLIDAAKGFRAYSILPEDVVRAIEVANRIAAEGGVSSSEGAFKLLTLGWMQEVLDACAERALCWMQAWQTLGQVGGSCLAADVRLQAGLPPAFR
jgi:hypothetical protein